MLCSVYFVEYTLNPNSMIEIVPELRPYGHYSSPMLAFLCKNLDYKPQSINQSTDVEMQLEAKRHRGPTAAVPPLAISLDQKGHWPTYAKRARCKLPGCTGFTKVTCQKCMTALCFYIR